MGKMYLTTGYARAVGLDLVDDNFCENCSDFTSK